jgi:hemolysin activation/secretion protein
MSLCAIPAWAQTTRPDAGTLLETQRQIPTLPQPGGSPTVVMPPAPPAAPFDSSVRVTPTAFRIQGNTLFSEAQLQANVAEFVGKPTDMDGLLKAAAAVRRFYRERGYLLTEAYLPQQQLAAAGGTVVIQVLEARVGKVAVRVEGDGLSESLANRIVRTHLHTGDHISEYALDKPILLLRDLSGFDASASVEPGTAVGEADITVVVKPFGPRFDGSIGADNFGVRSAGTIRAYANANINNPTGNGDQVSMRVQASENSDTNLYRLGYSIAVGGYGTRLGLSATKTEYALGKQFATLGAFGDAKVFGLSATHPFIRSRANNVLGAITLERKDLSDITSFPATAKDTRVDSVRLSLLGNFVDDIGKPSFNSYALNLVHGKVDLDAANLAIDQSPSGLGTAGSFTKLNVEAVRTMYFSAASRLVTSFQGQVASKNLVSAEKFTLGGPTGVRGYPVGEGVGDAGAIINLEYQHQLPKFGGVNVPLTASVFYDWGRIRYNQNNTTGITPNSESLGSVGVGLTAGTFGNYLVTTQLAWRTDRAPLSDPDRRPRVWVSVQKWL